MNFYNLLTLFWLSPAGNFTADSELKPLEFWKSGELGCKSGDLALWKSGVLALLNSAASEICSSGALHVLICLNTLVYLKSIIQSPWG